MSGEPLQKRVDLVLERLDRLPSPGAVAIRLFQATGSSETALSDVVSILRQDPGMAARVLSMCRRCHLGLAEEVDSLERAVVLLGFQEIRAATLAIEITGILGEADTHGRLEDLRRHSILVASLSRLIVDHSRVVDSIDPGAAYLGGLLHNLGHLALASAIPTPFSKLVDSASLSVEDLDETLLRVVGLDGPGVGGRMALAWGLPKEIERLVSRRVVDDDRPGAGVDEVVECADGLLRRSGFAPWRSRPMATRVVDRLERLGLTESEGDELVARALERASQDATTLGLTEEPPSTLLLKTLSRANAELERLAHQSDSIRRCDDGDILGTLAELRVEAGPEPLIREIHRAIVARHPMAGIRIAWRRGDRWYGRGETDEIVDLGTTPSSWVEGPVRVIVGEHTGCLVISSEEIPAVGDLEHRVLENLVRSAVSVAGRLDASDHRQAAERRSDRRIEARIEREADHRVAEVTAGAAHEINNPLSVVVGRSQILKSWSGDPSVTGSASEIFEAAQRIAGIVAGLHQHATAFDVSPTTVDGDELLQRCAEEAQIRLVGLGPVEIERCSNPVQVDLDVRRTIDLVVEACRNALEAQEDVQIRLRGSSDAANSRWNILIEDNGPGFGRSSLEHAFDPFFSLKPAGRKAGMGLTVARRIMEAQGGSAIVRNHGKGGGSVVFSFPLSEGTVLPRKAA